MNKKLLVTLLTLFVFSSALLLFSRYQTKKLSPADIATYDKDGLSIVVKYSRPYKKGRLIFGEASEGALQPYRRYWRVGANEATSIEFNQDVNFGGKSLKAGKYNLYAYPDRDEWEIVLGTEWNRWGFDEPQSNTEVMRIKVKADNRAPFREQFLISFDDNATMTMHWDETMLRIPVKVV